MTPGAAVDTEWRPTADLARLRLRADLLARVRAYFDATRALEVETPALVRAAVTDVHLESLRVADDATRGATVGYLQTSPEYAMKRLLCAGAPDIYQVCKVFRAGERGGRHNPEFTMLEWYRHGDHHALMRDVEALIRHVLEPERTFAASESITYCDAFQRRLGLDPLHAPVDAIMRAIEDAGTSVPESMRAGVARDDVLDLALGTVVAESFANDRLTFLYDFPASQAASRRSAARSRRASRRSGARSNWRTAFTNSVRRRNRPRASTPTWHGVANTGSPSVPSTISSWMRSRLACRPAPAWRSASIVS